MKLSKGFIVLGLFLVVFISGCDNGEANKTMVRTKNSVFELEANNTAWLRDHLPNETVAYLNIPTPWNYLFDAKADALHEVQSLPAHRAQVEKIKQGAKDNYFHLIPAQYQDMLSLLLEHMKTSLEVAVINNAPSAMLPTVAIGTRLQNIKSPELVIKISTLLTTIDPSIELIQQDQDPLWSFQTGQFPVFMQFDEASGRMLVYGGMGANKEKLSSLWNDTAGEQLQQINQLSRTADPSGLNLKMWMAPAKIYQMGAAFLQPEQQQMISELGLDQMAYLWLGFESAQGQSAMAMHVMMPDVGWRLVLPKANDWFDVELAGQPRSVLQFTLPTAEQIQQALAHFKVDEKLSAKDREELKILYEFNETFGFDVYDLLKAYHQQVYVVNDDSGSWYAMKIRDAVLHNKIEAKMNAYFDIKPEQKELAGQAIWQAHFSVFQKIFEASTDVQVQASEAFLNVFKDHAYWYVKDDVFYISSVPQVLAQKQATRTPLMLSDWLVNNQGGDWNSAIFAFGKDIKYMPQDLYHFYLLLLQGLGDLAQTEVDLFAFPTAEQLNLPDTGRINLVMSSDAEKVSFRFGYEYSFAEGILTGEGGLAVVAVVGILAATAIPAYRDYTVRVKINEQLAMAGVLKGVVAERILRDEVFNEATFEGIQEEVSIVGFEYYIDEETGMIVINMDGVDSALRADDELYLEPLINEDSVEWICYSTFKESYLPTSCKY